MFNDYMPCLKNVLLLFLIFGVLHYKKTFYK